MWDVAIIGAGLTGLTCAQQLAAAGQKVCVLDKSRGLGGRMATRRIGHLRVDHGLRYWQPATEGLQSLTAELLSAGILKQWPVSAYEIRQREVIVPIAPGPIYIAPEGMSAIGKYLARDLSADQILTSYRAVALNYHNGHWEIHCEGRQTVVAKRCAIAIPAPQAAALLSTRLTDDDEIETIDPIPTLPAIAQLRAVEYWPCLTVIAGYERDRDFDMGPLDPNGWMVSDFAGTSTYWVGLDSSKRDAVSGPVLVIHSKAPLAQQYIDAQDLQPAASVLLRANARKLCEWIAQPEWFQIHRWRYAQVRVPHRADLLVIKDSLISGGDWCIPPVEEAVEGTTAAGDKANTTARQNIDYAYLSGLAMAKALQNASE